MAPSIGLLIVFRVVQGFGGGVAAVVARAVVVDVAKGDLLAKVMSIMMAVGGLAPMVAPILGGTVLTLGGTWRTVFWFLVGFGLLMMITAIVFVPESLPRERRHGGGLRQFGSGLSQVLRVRLYVGYMLTAALSGATMMAYIANSSYVLQVQKGLRPLPFALFFASTALAQILLSVVNAKIVGRRFQPRTLIGFGLTLATLAVAALTVGVFALDTPLLLTCAGFLVLMAVQAFIFGNANALAAAEVPHIAGAASAVLGVTQAVAMATSAPLASSGGAATAVPMIWVMIAGIAGSLFAYLVLARPSADRTVEPSPTDRGVPVVHQYLVVANHLSAARSCSTRSSIGCRAGRPSSGCSCQPRPPSISSTTSTHSVAPSPSNSTYCPAPERATKALLTRSPTLTPNCTVFARSAPQPTAPWATRTR